jgi:outer membrane biosynthesis protein TonB
MKNRFSLFLLLVFASFFSEKSAAQALAPDSIYLQAQVMPEYPGGRAALTQFLIKNVKMPKECRDAQVGGMTVVEFVVEKDGSPSNFKVAVSAKDRYESDVEKFELAEKLDAEALRLAEAMSKWSIASIDGQPVRIRMRLPVRFTAF